MKVMSLIMFASWMVLAPDIVAAGSANDRGAACRDLQRDIQTEIGGSEGRKGRRRHQVRDVVRAVRAQAGRRRIGRRCGACIVRQFARKDTVSEQRPCGTHDVCVVGQALAPGVDSCVNAVCERHRRCCTARWGRRCVEAAVSICGETCERCDRSHCETGRALARDCDPCTERVCDADPYCCDTAWDSQCVEGAAVACGLTCSSAATTTSTTTTSSTTATAPPACRSSAECDDSDPCTVDRCDPSVGCVNWAYSCERGEVCSDNACDGHGGCTFPSTPPPCDDGNPCTVGDVCLNDSCIGGELLDCGDGDPCTVDYCDSSGACRHDPLDCNDGDACTADHCDATQGCSSQPISCDDGDDCTVDSCDFVRGCVAEPDPALCP